MRMTLPKLLTCMGMMFLLALGANLSGTAQGRGKGKSSGKAASKKSNGSEAFDKDAGKASKKSKGKSKSKSDDDSDSDSGSKGKNKRNDKADKDDNDYPGSAHALGRNPDELKKQYEDARAANPDLKFGHFVAANAIAKNAGQRHSNVTTEAILDGLAEGKSIGQTLQDLGMSSKEARDAEKEADRGLKKGKKKK